MSTEALTPLRWARWKTELGSKKNPHMVRVFFARARSERLDLCIVVQHLAVGREILLATA